MTSQVDAKALRLSQPRRAMAAAPPAQPRLEEMWSLFLAPLPWWKRLEDLLGALLALAALAPLMLALALAVACTSPGPVIYRQARVGQGGRVFQFYKFRTMVVDAEIRQDELAAHNLRQGPAFKLARDPRVTPLGRFLRRFSLDELPQLVNVLKGDMSLVGPRPPLPREVAKYQGWQLRRLEVRPGITGLWQVSARHEADFDKWVRLDILYARRCSPWTDLKIICRTIPAVLGGKGAA